MGSGLSPSLWSPRFLAEWGLVRRGGCQELGTCLKGLGGCPGKQGNPGAVTFGMVSSQVSQFSLSSVVLNMCFCVSLLGSHAFRFVLEIPTQVTRAQLERRERALQWQLRPTLPHWPYTLLWIIIQELWGLSSHVCGPACVVMYGSAYTEHTCTHRYISIHVCPCAYVKNVCMLCVSVCACIELGWLVSGWCPDCPDPPAGLFHSRLVPFPDPSPASSKCGATDETRLSHSRRPHVCPSRLIFFVVL